MHLGRKSMLSQAISQVSRGCKLSLGRPKKLGGITPKRLVYPIGCAFTETGCDIYRNWVCVHRLPI